MTYEEMLFEIANADERYMVLTAENRAFIRSLPARLGERFVDTGITEQTMVGMAAGLALRGRFPVAHALATFLTMRAFEFIRTDVGIAKLPVKLVGAFPGVLSEANGPTHQALEDVALMRGIPGVGIFCPADEEDLVIGLPKVLAANSPFYIRYANLPAAVPHSPDFELGKAEAMHCGDEVVILTYGALFSQAYNASKLLQEHGISVKLLNMRTLVPFDNSAVIKCARDAGLLVTVEDHFLIGGLYSIVSELLVREQISVEVLPVAFEDRWFKPAMLQDVLEFEEMTARHLAKRIKSALNDKVKNHVRFS